MSEDRDTTPPADQAEPEVEQKEKVKELLEKDAKTARQSTGVWRWLTALLGGAMVIFYFYTAGITSVATQYHRGVYVFITYVLVFLLYPASKAGVRGLLALFTGAVAACTGAALLFYPDVASFHQRLTQAGEGIASALALWPLALGSLTLAALLFVADRWTERRWPGMRCGS